MIVIRMNLRKSIYGGSGIPETPIRLKTSSGTAFVRLPKQQKGECMKYFRKIVIPVFLLVLLVTSLGATVSGGSNYSHDDIRFRGMVYSANRSVTGYLEVKVFRSLSGANISGQKVRVGPFGVSRCNINVRSKTGISMGDMVEVYGLHEKVMYMEGPTVDVDLCHSNSYYVRKIQDNDGDDDEEDETCQARIWMDQKQYQIGDSARLSVRFDRGVRYNITQGGPSGRSTIRRGSLQRARKLTIEGKIEGPTGKKYVKVEARGGGGSGCSDVFYYRVVDDRNEEPVARCGYRPSRPKVGQTVYFSGSDSFDPDGRITEYGWYFFQDGSIDRYGKRVTHAFSQPGYQEVKLTVRDDQGATSSTTCSVRVEERNREPIAKFEYQPPQIKVGEKILFSAADSNDPDGYLDEYRWDLNDDNYPEAEGKTIMHTFEEAGHHRVTLEVLDNYGATDKITRKLKVEEEEGEIRLSTESLSGEKLDSDIYLNGDFVGSTGSNGSLDITDLNPGHYEIESHSQGYEKSTARIYLSGGETENVALVMEKKVDLVFVNSIAEGIPPYFPKNPDVGDWLEVAFMVRNRGKARVNDVPVTVILKNGNRTNSDKKIISLDPGEQDELKFKGDNNIVTGEVDHPWYKFNTEGDYRLRIKIDGNTVREYTFKVTEAEKTYHPSYDLTKEISSDRGQGFEVERHAPGRGWLQSGTILIQHPGNDIFQLFGKGKVMEDAETYYGILVDPDELDGPGDYEVDVTLSYKHLQASFGFSVDPFTYSASVDFFKGDITSLKTKIHSTTIKEKKHILEANVDSAIAAILDHYSQGGTKLVDALFKHLEYSWGEPKRIPIKFRTSINESMVLWFGGKITQELSKLDPSPSAIPSTETKFGFASLEITFEEIQIREVD